MEIPYVWVAPDAVTAHVYATPACQSSSSGNSGFVASRRPCQPASQPAVVVVVYRRRLESASATGTRLRLSAVRSMPAVGIQLQHDHFTYTPSIWIFVYMSTYMYIAGTRKMASLGGDIRAYMLRFQAGLPLLRIFFIWFCNVAVWFVWFLADYEYEYFLCSLAICGRGKVSLISVYIAENGIVHGLTDCFNG